MAHLSPVTVSGDKRSFRCAGRPWFYFADTVWAAFSNATEEEWNQYTMYRREQGFNVLQISVLPVLHDASETYVGDAPYASADGYRKGPWDFGKPSKAFFGKAERMVALAAERGLRTCLTLLWNNYVPETWGNTRRPDVTIPGEALEDYAALVAETFKAYNPIYFISGDTKFETDKVVDYFMTGLEVVKKVDPSALASMHIGGRSSDLPSRVVDSPLLDFYTYQSGHRIGDQHMSWKLAEEFRSRYPVRPIVNAEPCYEGHGHARGENGRFTAFDLRKAFWSSVLAGAHAGFTYGGHGVWSWHRRGSFFTSVANSRIPFDWTSGMRLQGAWDTAYGKHLFEDLGLWDLEPAQELLSGADEGIRAAVVKGADGKPVRAAVYLPYPVPVDIGLDAKGYDVKIIDLASRYPHVPELSSANGRTIVEIPEVNADCLVVFNRR